MERITGFAAHDAIGKTCAILNFSRCFGKKCPANLKKCGIMKHGSSEVKDCFLQHKEGQEVPVIKNANVVKDENDKIIGVVETVTDLTELNKARLKAQEATRRLREMHRLGNIFNTGGEWNRKGTGCRRYSFQQ